LTGAFSTTGTQIYNDAVALTGTTTFSGAAGNTTPLTSLTANAGGTTDINSGSVTTSGNQIYNDNVTMNKATTVTSTGGAITFGANATNNAAGAGITVDAPTINLTSGTTIATTGNGAISFFTDTLNPNGASINAGTGTFTLAPNVLTRTIEFGDVNTGRVTDVYYGLNFGSVTAGSFTIGRPTHTGNIYVTGVAAALSAMTFVNGGVGSVTFENAPYVSGNQSLGVVSGSGGIDLGTNLTLGTGSVSLTALTGSILDGNVGANNLNASTANLTAANSIGTTGDPLDTTVNVLNASTTAGGIFISEADAVTLGTVSATGGNIAVSNSTGDMTITSVSAPAGPVDLSALGGSILSGGGAGPHLTAGGNSTLQAFNGVVGTQAAPINVAVNPGTLGIRATTAIGGISAFLTGTVPGNALTKLNVPPGLVCFNGCSVSNSPVSALATSTFGYLNPETIIPAYYPQPSRSVLISDITSVYMPGTLLHPSPVSLSSGSPAIQSMGPKAKARTNCEQGAAASFDTHCTVR
ncbi:MAG: hypothetical protein ND866_17635, partial [Pyrinomonadaceae bacterium]|nr:hypothetical protein [Pyrinomonadaceae bacterium]